mmetsp:Transcript_3539/g.10321  ORF Transcript_3539/g.10321 Transcript_3539/m.10321 type:complete len:161 (+) Transcript_3539:88-570(+)
MKLSIVAGCALLLSQQAAAFNVAPNLRPATSLGMFSGAGAAAPKEDNPEEAKQVEAAAKAMGMSVEEYTLAMNARARLAETLDQTMVSAGNADTVLVERDLNNPSKKFEVKITDEGKALGKEELSKKIVAALKKTADEARTGRGKAQKDMMEYIGEQMKK